MKRLLLLALLAGCTESSKVCHESNTNKKYSLRSSINGLKVSGDLLAVTNMCARELESLFGDNFNTMKAHVVVYDVATDFYCEKKGKKIISKDTCATLSDKGRRETYVREVIDLFLSKCILQEYKRITDK